MYNFHFTVKGDDTLEQIFIIIVTKFLLSVIDRIFFYIFTNDALILYMSCVNLEKTKE